MEWIQAFSSSSVVDYSHMQSICCVDRLLSCKINHLLTVSNIVVDSYLPTLSKDISICVTTRSVQNKSGSMRISSVDMYMVHTHYDIYHMRSTINDYISAKKFLVVNW